MSQQRILHERYRVDQLIGRGGMADVFRGHDLRLNRTVAVKMMRPDLARDPAFQARFRQEARHAASLNHPCVVSVFDTGAAPLDDGFHPVECPYLVMEHVDGHTLRERLHAGEVTWREAVRWTTGLLEALDHAHEQGVVHRDVKPANLMVSRSGAVKVMDFGIARALSDTSAHTAQTQAVVGTALYLPPEQAQGARMDARSDLYAAGCVLFELLTGRPPFTGDTPLAIAYQHVREEPPAPSAVDPSLPEAFDAVVLRALEKDPARRHPDAAALLADIEAAAADAEAGRSGPARTQALPLRPADDGGSPAPTPTGAPTAAAPPVSPAAAPLSSAGPAESSADEEPTAGASSSDRHAVAGAGVPGAPSASQLAAAAAVGAGTPSTGPIPVGAAGERTEAVPVVAAAAPAAERRGRSWPLVAALTAALVLAALLVWSLVGRPDTVTMPELTDSMEAQAVSRLTGLGLEAVVRTDAGAAGPAGRVVSTDPGAGTEVEEGSRVSLTVSGGGTQVLLPTRLRGVPEARVRAELERLGLAVASVEDTHSADVVRGSLVQTEPALGTRVSPGTAVVLHVSDGTMHIPDLTGMTGADARRTVEALAPEMTLRFQSEAGSDPEEGVVVLQDPPAGSDADNDAMLTLITSAAEAPTAEAVTAPPAGDLAAPAPTVAAAVGPAARLPEEDDPRVAAVPGPALP
ncbi:Stk1 family PASTA domain-containing Ser/Thr kinase, partial [Micrococcus sp.]|uniref:Stk1 family PASTA domain-containing Ser/Thr kinase n=1 Tax=Micrococcus sp. TaxID=1271 RepID=UPI0026DD8C29